MCQQTTNYHSCHHTSFGSLTTCSFPRLPGQIHPITPTQINIPTPCLACASRIYIPPIPPAGMSYGPVPVSILHLQQVRLQPEQIFYPQQQIIYPSQGRMLMPQLTPGPGSYGTPLPAPGNTSVSMRLELAGGRWMVVPHYHPPPPGMPPVVVGPNGRVGLSAGYNMVHGYDFGGLPPGWNAGGQGTVPVAVHSVQVPAAVQPPIPVVSVPVQTQVPVVVPVPAPVPVPTVQVPVPVPAPVAAPAPPAPTSQTAPNSPAAQPTTAALPAQQPPTSSNPPDANATNAANTPTSGQPSNSRMAGAQRTSVPVNPSDAAQARTSDGDRTE